MDAAWVQVFVLTISQCVAPEGKTVCQEEIVTLDFLSRSDCEAALEEFTASKNADDRVILNVDATRCSTTVRKREVWASIESASEAFASVDDFEAPDAREAQEDFVQVAHDKRLSEVPDCIDGTGIYPCRRGQIIVEEPATREIEVWRLDSAENN